MGYIKSRVNGTVQGMYCDICGKEYVRVVSNPNNSSQDMCVKCYNDFYNGGQQKDKQIAELKAENERLKDENKVLKEIRGLKSKELKKRPHELTQKEAYQNGWENAISETIRTFEFNYGKDKVELVEERDKYFSDIYRIGGYKFTIEDLQQQLKDNTKRVCEKIRKWGNKHFNWVGDGTGYDGQDYNEMIGFNNAITKLLEFLDQIGKGEKE